MTPKQIATNHASVSCDVCGRTLLRGEVAEITDWRVQKILLKPQAMKSSGGR